VRSIDASAGYAKHSSPAASERAKLADVPASLQSVAGLGPYLETERHVPSLEQIEHPESLSSIRAASRHAQSESEQHQPPPLSYDGIKEDVKEHSHQSQGMGMPVDGCAVSAAAVNKDVGATVSAAVQELLRPVGTIKDDWKISSARPGLEQYADLRCRLWRPPDEAQIFAAAIDYGQPSDVSGYCTEDSKCMSSSCTELPENQLVTLDRRCAPGFSPFAPITCTTLTLHSSGAPIRFRCQ
jgi:hypothetical protein